MPGPQRLTSADNPRIKAVVRLRQQRQRRKTGLFLVESVRDLERAQVAGLKLVEMFVCPEMLGRAPPAPGWAGLWEVTPALLKKMAYRQNPEGIVAVFEQPRWRLNELGSLPGADLWLLAVGTTKPGNLGAMARTVWAAGGSGLLIADAVVDVFNPNAIRASTGAVFRLPIVAGDAAQIIAWLKHRGVKLYAATPGAGTNYTEVDLRAAAAIAIGPEHEGLDDRWRQAAADSGGCCITIPMPGSDVTISGGGMVDSLNASATAAVLMFEAVRQRGVVEP